MKVLFLTNNPITEPLIQWLRARREEVVVWDKKITRKYILGLQPDFVISYNYRFIIKSEVIALLPGKIINLHISYLPWNRGADPTFWSFFDNTPKGVTIHRIDEGIDTGEIIYQKEMNFDEEKETLASTYATLHAEIQSIFKTNWRRIRNLSIPARKQRGKGSYHGMKDLTAVKEQFKDSLYTLKIALLKRKLYNRA